jgi:hypothetical protein
MVYFLHFLTYRWCHAKEKVGLSFRSSILLLHAINLLQHESAIIVLHTRGKREGTGSTESCQPQQGAARDTKYAALPGSLIQKSYVQNTHNP